MSTETTELHALRDIVDRQIIDGDDLLVGKVDDCLLVHDADGTRVAGVLCGAGALAARLGGRLGERFEDLVRRLSAPEWEPRLVTLDLLCRTDNGFRLTVTRDYLRATAPRVRGRPGPLETSIDDVEELRLSDLVGSEVHTMDGTHVAPVGDVRLRVDGPATGVVIESMTVDGLIVGLGSIGDRLGFRLPRGPKRPFAVNHLFRALAHEARVVPWTAVRRLEARAVYIDSGPDDLAALPEPEA
jgi:sporulation protein YlmC with PRC-barrel domain